MVNGCKEITSAELISITSKGGELYLLDVREDLEVANGIIPGAIHIPLTQVQSQIQSKIERKNIPVYIYCAAGVRSLVAARTLQSLGYQTVYSISDGYNGYSRNAGCSISSARYARQVILPQIGETGQQRLREAVITLIGIGGIGSPLALYLAGAGIGTLRLIDPDTVNLNNLHRQIIYRTSEIGSRKVEAAAKSLHDLNPEVLLQICDSSIDQQNGEELLTGSHLVIDGSDNFDTRYLVNDLCFKLEIPFIHASVHQFEGIVALFTPDTPCFRCLFPTPPPDRSLPNCSESGVLGALVGIIATLAATEALKFILQIGDLLSGKLITYNALNHSNSVLELTRSKDCRCTKTF